MFVSRVAFLLNEDSGTVTVWAVFSDDQTFAYDGLTFWAQPDGSGTSIGQVYIVIPLSNGALYNYPVSAPYDVAEARGFIANGSVLTALYLYEPLYAPPQPYLIIQALDPDTLAALVNTAMSQGYAISGSVFEFGLKICQPMMLVQS
jgi:hypothetical protein